MPSSLPPEIDLPENLHRQMKGFRSRLWRIKITEALLAGVVGFVLSYLALFLSDRFWSTPPAVGIVILIGGTILPCLFAPYWLHRWVWKERRANQLARLLSRKFPQLGDRILGIVELEGLDRQNPSYSEALRKAAIRQVADEAAEADFSLAIPKPRHKTAIAMTLVLAALLGALVYWAPEASLNSFTRWLTPAGNTPRYTFTRLENVPEKIYVPMGETFPLKVTLDPSSKRKVDSIRARCNGVVDLSVPLTETAEGQWTGQFSFPGIFEQSLIRLDAGDADYDIVAVPCLRPNIAQLYAEVTYPEYTGKEKERVSLRTGALYALQGSTARLYAQSTSPLESAFLLTENDSRTPLETKESTVVFPEQELNESREFSFSWTDIYGIEAQAPFKIRMEAVEDAAPEVYLQGPAREIFLLERESIELELIASDDLGLMDLGLEWTGSDSRNFQILSKGGKRTSRLDAKFMFQAEALGITPQKLTLHAMAKDYKPGREYKRSSPLTIVVLTKNEHAQKIKERLEQLSITLEELAQREQLLIDESARLKKMELSDLITPENRQALKELADSEKEHAQKLQELIDELSDTFQKALRNDEIEPDSMRPFLEAKGILEKIPPGSQKKAQEALKQAAAENNTPEKTEQELDSAHEEQQKTWEEMNSALKKISQSAKNMEAGTFVARLKKAAGQEREIAHLFSAAINNSIGLTIQELSPGEQRGVTQSSLLQKEILRDLYWISDDLKHFFSRSNIEAHNKVANEISNTLIEPDVDNLPGIISKNLGAMAIEGSTSLETLLSKWAEMIAGTKSKKKQGGGGGAGNGEDGDDMSESEFDFMLKVMRMIQTQQDLRSRTRLLEEDRRQASPAPAESTEEKTAPPAEVATPNPES